MVRIVTLMILARLLTPSDFGLVGMVTAATGIFSLFKDAGLSMVTVQRATISNDEVSTLFWLNVAVGLLLGLLTVLMAPILVSFYQEPDLFWVAASLAIGFVFNGVGVQHRALLQRDMKFGVMSGIDVLAQIVASAVGIGMGLSGYGYWALVGTTVANPAASTACSWVAKKWLPGMPNLGVGWQSMVRFGGIATLQGFVMCIASNLDKILLGRYWGAEILGIYGRASQLIAIPSDNLNAATGSVLFSGLSRLQHDSERIKNYFLKSYSLILSLTIPSTIACAIFAEDIVALVLGPKWGGVTVSFQLLSPAIMVIALMQPTYWLMIALGMASRTLRMSCIIGPLIILGYVLGLPYGAEGVAMGYSVVMILWVIPGLAWSVYGSGISLNDLWRSIRSPLISAMAAAMVAWSLQWFYAQALSPLLNVVVSGCILLTAYIMMLFYVMRQKRFYLQTLEGLTGWSFTSAAVRTVSNA